MTTNERYVFDTNVIVSALLFEDSKPAQAFFSALRIGAVIVSLPVLHELNDVLRRRKFDRYLSQQEREQFLNQLTLTATLVEIVEHVSVCRDPKDDKFLELAVNGRAILIVTGDDDLLVLNPYRGISIITPDQFLKRG